MERLAIESLGRSPFIEVTFPETAVRLEQQLGRLIRTDEDPRHDDDPGSPPRHQTLVRSADAGACPASR